MTLARNVLGTELLPCSYDPLTGLPNRNGLTEALDRLLAEYDDLDVIANHPKRH